MASQRGIPDPLLVDAELAFFPAYTTPHVDPAELVRARFRRVVSEAIAAAEQRGYQRAIDALRNTERWAQWRAEDIPIRHPLAEADYLEWLATQPTDTTESADVRPT